MRRTANKSQRNKSADNKKKGAIVFIILLALLMPLAASAQPKSGGLKIPPKKTATTKPVPKAKQSATKSSGSKNSSANTREKKSNAKVSERNAKNIAIKTIYYPSYKSSTSSPNRVRIKKVILSSNFTAFEMISSNDIRDTYNHVNGQYLSINKELHLVCRRKNYKLIKAEGVSINPQKTFFSYYPQEITYTLYFEPIPINATTIDIEEPPHVIDRYGTWGIDLRKSGKEPKDSNVVFMSQEDRDRVIQNLIKNKMVYVEGGTFIMGATPEQGDNIYFNGRIAHPVNLSSFYICKFEINQAEWDAVMGYNNCKYKGADLPVMGLNWNDCLAFLCKLNRMTGKKFRLPTEAEWEYAARGGKCSKGYIYAGSNNLDEVAWYEYNSNNRPHPVGTKMPNELGIYDMSGNVKEWVQDRHSETYYDRVILLYDPEGPDAGSGDGRIYRGGAYSDHVCLNVAARSYSASPYIRGGTCGFRIVCRNL